MEGDLEITSPADRAIPGLVGEIGIARGAGGGCGGGGGGGGGSGAAAGVMVDSMAIEWTDEKHSLYLNSMEESFVNQLYNHGFGSNDFFSNLGWTSRTQKDPKPLTSRLEYSGQFKVLHGGCWGEVKFERPRTRADIQNETRVLSRNPWIQHFRSASNDKMVDSASSNHLVSDEIAGQSTNTGRQNHGITDCGEERSLNHLPACSTHICHRDSIVANTEVSDQNFVDDFDEARRSRRVCKKKRSRMTFSDARDQVVPFGETTAPTSIDGKIFPHKGKDADCSSTKAAKI